MTTESARRPALTKVHTAAYGGLLTTGCLRRTAYGGLLTMGFLRRVTYNGLLTAGYLRRVTCNVLFTTNFLLSSSLPCFSKRLWQVINT